MPGFPLSMTQWSSSKLRFIHHGDSTSEEDGPGQMAGIKRISHPLTLRRIALVAVVSSIIVSSAIIVDVSLAGYDYEPDEPSVSHDFPETIYFYNISEGVTAKRSVSLLSFQ
jgi:hypothetical protein